MKQAKRATCSQKVKDQQSCGETNQSTTLDSAYNDLGYWRPLGCNRLSFSQKRTLMMDTIQCLEGSPESHNFYEHIFTKLINCLLKVPSVHLNNCKLKLYSVIFIVSYFLYPYIFVISPDISSPCFIIIM